VSRQYALRHRGSFARKRLSNGQNGERIGDDLAGKPSGSMLEVSAQPGPPDLSARSRRAGETRDAS
jgi:hypothetical protein